MSNPSKKKGTSGETGLLRLLNAFGFRFVRTAPTLNYDLVQFSKSSSPRSFDVLATRPDRGRWLFTIDADAFIELLDEDDLIRIEVKRFARFAHHAIYEEKFGRSK